MPTLFTNDLFVNPSKDFYSVPFWAWNGKLDKELLKKQIDDADQMGYGGFIMHPRIGLSTPYLGKDYMACIKYCQEYADSKNMVAWLYDEDKWPSGFGGGFVTKNKKYRARYILFTPTYYPEGNICTTLRTGTRLTSDGEATLLAKYQLDISEGRMISYHIISEEDSSEYDNIWYAYRVVLGNQPWFNNQGYVDILNPEATRCFLNEVYEKYAQLYQNSFPNNMPLIFSDEPQCYTWQSIPDGNKKGEGGIVYTEKIFELYERKYHKDLTRIIPELFFDWDDGHYSNVRYNYCSLVAELYDTSYAGVIEPWCKQHKIMNTGHLMDEATLEGQSRTGADLVRCYRNYDLPGIDILADRIEYTTAKQAQSISRQFGKLGVCCEMYGVTNWNFDFRQKKIQGDWLAALGVNYRIPHLMWLYMGGESKRDYPAPLDSHSPWYKNNRILEDYYARLATVLRNGKSVVNIAVLHPIESYWMVAGAREQSLSSRKLLEDSFATVTNSLTCAGVDFDYIDEQILSELCTEIPQNKINVGEMSYSLVIIPEIVTIRKTTLDILQSFQKNGGKIITLGACPRYIDAEENDLAQPLYEKALHISYDQLIDSLSSYRDIFYYDTNNNTIQGICAQERLIADDHWVFIAHSMGAVPQDTIVIRKKGEWTPRVYDAFNGKILFTPSRYENGYTEIICSFHQHDSLLIRFVKGKQIAATPKNNSERIIYDIQIPESYDCVAEEQNTLLLDMMEYSIDNNNWFGQEEILRIDDTVRQNWGMRLRTDAFPQPWLTQKESKKEHHVFLKKTVQSKIQVAKAYLIWEGNDDVTINWNGIPVEHTSDYYLDTMLHKSPLYEIRIGENILEVDIPFNENTNIEWMYITGDFGVEEEQGTFYISKMPTSISLGDYSKQGFPFYGGNMVYLKNLDLPAGRLSVSVSEYNAPLLDVSIDDSSYVPIILNPYEVDLGVIESGKHTLRIRAYGSRINTFGQIHNANMGPQYFGPKSWRTSGEEWSYSYRSWPCGISGQVSVKITSSEE